MNISTRTSLLASSFTILLSGTAIPHDTWLLPDRFQVSPGQRVTLDLTSGMAFPELETGPKRERVESAQCRLAGRTFDISDISAGPKSLRFKTEVHDSGVASFWVKLPPKSIELKPDQVEEYLEEIDAPSPIRKAWTEMEPKRWRELYSKHQKTFVRVGEAPPADRSWTEPAGIALEIVPEKDPTALREGDEFPVRVLKNGAPFAGFALNAVAGGATKGETRTTDAAGRAVFKLDKAGPWLLRGTDVRKLEKPEADWESDFTTLTVEVASP